MANTRSDDGEHSFLVPWDLLRPKSTPSLRLVSFHYLDNDICANIHDLFEDAPNRDLGLRLFHRGDLYGDVATYDEYWKRYVCDFDDSRVPGRYKQLMLPEAKECDPKRGLVDLRLYTTLTHLGIALPSDPYHRDSEYMSLLFDILDQLRDLEALRLDCSLDPTLDVEAVAMGAAERCCKLSYIRVGWVSWGIVRDDGSRKPRLIVLDKWKDAIVCPGFLFGDRPPCSTLALPPRITLSEIPTARQSNRWEPLPM